jgi:hypothetical protein
MPRQITERHGIGQPSLSLLLRWPNLREHEDTMFPEGAPIRRVQDGRSEEVGALMIGPERVRASVDAGWSGGSRTVNANKPMLEFQVAG